MKPLVLKFKIINQVFLRTPHLKNFKNITVNTRENNKIK